MEYREFGNTGAKVSKLGFGAMRLPGEEKDGNWLIDEDKSIELLTEGLKAGINYIDTAFPYCHEQSEMVVGKAVKSWEGEVYVSSKSPIWRIEKEGDYRKYLEISLERLDRDYIDFYHFHNLSEYFFEEKIDKYNVIEEAQKLKEEGLIKHISFSFHDYPEFFIRLVNMGIMETVLCQYNFLDTTNEDAIAYAVSKGVGVAAMGPVAGGRVRDLKVDAIKGSQDIDIVSLALRFVFSNKDISTALSGMEDLEMLRANLKTAEGPEDISSKEKDFIETVLGNAKVQETIPCNECDYCEDCPNDIPISRIFKNYNYYLLTDLEGPAKWQYGLIGKYDNNSQADKCSECGQCEDACPQNIEIIEELKKIHKVFS
jgi:predicted aldo/keto reductase-like oxidoreductase